MAGRLALRRSPQLLAEACGSRSMIAAMRPARCAATAIERARVVFPVPAFLSDDRDNVHFLFLEKFQYDMSIYQLINMLASRRVDMTTRLPRPVKKNKKRGVCL